MSSRPLLPQVSEVCEANEKHASSWRSQLRSLCKRSDWLACFLGPAISVPFAACYAALVCRQKELQPHFPVVLQQVMWTQLAGSIIALFVGQFVTTTNLDPLTAILFGQLSRRVMVHFQGPSIELLLPNMMLAMPIMTVFLGLALYAVGRLKLAFMLRFFPYTVVGGFLAGSGVLILQESLALAAGVEVWDLARETLPVWLGGSIDPAATAQSGVYIAGCWAQIGLAVAFSWLMEAVRDLHIFGTPLLMACSVGLSLAVEAASGGNWPPRSWFLSFPEPVSWWEPFELLAQGLRGDFRPTQALDLEFAATFVTIMTVSWSINTLAVAKLVPLRPGLQRCEEQGEIQSLGLTNIILGGLGCYSSMQSFKIPMIMRGVKSGPLWPFFNVAVNCLLFIASPRAIIRCVPRFLFAGSVVRLSCDLIAEWLLEARNRIAQKEWYVLAATALVVVLNVTLGIIFGLFLTLILFAVEYSSVTGVFREGCLSETRSNVERSEEEHALLRKHGASAHILWLSGYFFFGSATQVADEVRAAVEEKGVSVVILDFSLVPAMDASGVYAIVELAQELWDSPRKARLVLCGLVRRLQKALESAAQHQQVDSLELHHDLDQALECCETQILAAAAATGSRSPRPVRKHSGLSKIDSMNCISTYGAEAFSREVSDDEDGGIWEQLLAEELQELDPGHSAVRTLQRLAGKPRLVEAGEVLFRHGEPATELLVLLDGSVEVTQPSPEHHFLNRLPRHHLNVEKGDVYVFEENHRRVRRARAGAVFGAVEYAGSRTEPSPAASAAGKQVNGLSHGPTVVGANLRSTGTAIGGCVEVLVISFEVLRRAEHEEPKLALVLRTWLSRLAADALISMPHPDHLSRSHAGDVAPRPLPCRAPDSPLGRTP